jgi:RND family efflux transporter MFP subunit
MFITKKYDAREGVLLLITVLMLSSLAITGCESPEAEETTTAVAEVPRNVRVLVVGTSDLDEFLEITGPVQPVRGAVVSAEESGRVESVPHDRGDRVEGGDVLVELDRRMLKAEVAAARAAVAQQDHNAETTGQLQAAGKVSQQELLDIEALAAQARAILEASLIRYDRAAISTPFAGLVVDRYVEPGELVQPGTPVARVIDPFTLKIEGTVTERDIGWVHEGAGVMVQLDGADEPVHGIVHWVGFEADSKTGKFKVEIRLDNADLQLRSGVVGRASIHRRTIHGVVVVPRDAVLSTSEGPAVYVAENDRAVLNHVVLGADQGLMVEVVSGLVTGDALIVRGHRELVEHALLQITERSTRRDGGVDGDPAAVAEASAAPRGDQEASQ